MMRRIVRVAQQTLGWSLFLAVGLAVPTLLVLWL